MDMEFELDGGFIENHPLNIFTRLYAEDKKNKVYKDCLENEINEAIVNLSENIDDDTIKFLKTVLDCYSITDDELECLDESIVKDELKMKMYVTKKIILNVYKNRFNQE